MSGERATEEAYSARLAEYRRQIDELDRRLVALLNERARLAQAIGRLKADGEDRVYHPEREAQVLRNVLAANRGPLPDRALLAIYSEILSASRALQQPLRVAYLGPVATFTHEAAKRRFGSSAEFIPCRTIADVFLATQRGEADYGVVPVENSTEGAVAHTLDMFLDTDLQICAEILLPISHNLLGRGRLDQIRRVYSNPQALAQCRRWLQENLPQAELIEVASTARAAQLVTDEESAAIANAAAAEVYGLPIIAARIEDSATNLTRFLVIGPRRSPPSGHDRSAVIFAVRDRVGALHDALGVFARHGINLTRIESRPSKRRPWEYVFFVDLEGHPEDAHVQAALRELEEQCTMVKVLGAWPVEPSPVGR